MRTSDVTVFVMHCRHVGVLQTVRAYVRKWLDAAAWTIAWWLPRKVALYAFVRVYAADMTQVGADYGRVYNTWENGAGR